MILLNRCIQEEDILDMLAQCETDEKDGRGMARTTRGPKVVDIVIYHNLSAFNFLPYS